MKTKLEIRPPQWKRIVRHKSHELKGEFLEMVLGYFLSSEVTNHVLDQTNDVFIGSILHGLQGNNNIIGILRVVLPLFLLGVSHFLRKLAAYLLKRGACVYDKLRGFLVKKIPPPSEPSEAI